MRLQARRWTVGALAVAGVAGAIFAWRQSAAPEPPPADATLGQVQEAGPLPVSSQAGAPRAGSTVPASVLADGAGQPLSALVGRLLATRDPKAALAAYYLVSSCATFNDRHDLQVYDDKLRVSRGMNASERQHIGKMCGGMTERERQARLDYLALAAKAGVPGAAWAFVVEGPFGDPSALKTRPDDPLVREWKTTATTQMKQAAESGDLSALLIWGFQNLGGSDLANDPVQGYSYLLAFGFIQADRFGPGNTGAQEYRDGSVLMNAMGGRLTPEQRAASVAAARRIADKVKAEQPPGAAIPVAPPPSTSS